jgi:hypothetical protein
MSFFSRKDKNSSRNKRKVTSKKSKLKSAIMTRVLLYYLSMTVSKDLYKYIVHLKHIYTPKNWIFKSPFNWIWLYCFLSLYIQKHAKLFICAFFMVIDNLWFWPSDKKYIYIYSFVHHLNNRLVTYSVDIPFA